MRVSGTSSLGSKRQVARLRKQGRGRLLACEVFRKSGANPASFVFFGTICGLDISSPHQISGKSAPRNTSFSPKKDHPGLVRSVHFGRDEKKWPLLTGAGNIQYVKFACLGGCGGGGGHWRYFLECTGGKSDGSLENLRGGRKRRGGNEPIPRRTKLRAL